MNLPRLPLLILLLFGFSHLMYAQGDDGLKESLQQDLRTYLVNLEPENSCECNECKHVYAGRYKITKRQVVGETLRLYGVAAAKYKSLYSAGESKIYFYAEYVKQGGEPVLIKMKWRKGECMKFQTIMSSVARN